MKTEEYLDPSEQPPEIIFHDGMVGSQAFLSAVRWRDQWVVTPLHTPGIRIVDDEDISQLTYLGCEVVTPDRCGEGVHAVHNCHCY